MSLVPIALDTRSYDISIGADVRLSTALEKVDFKNRNMAVIVTNSTVAPLHLAVVQQQLQAVFKRVEVVTLPDGEVYKTWDSMDQILTAMLGWGCDRNVVLFALGGGVVGDVTGFAAATYMRGVPFVQLPTTLLAQVDSSVGGKTAINHPLGKNMIGAFYQPRAVVCDIAYFATLPTRELAAGLAEVIKYGPIADMAFFEWLEQSMPQILAKESEAMSHVVQRCCEIKAAVVSSDEREAGLRAILNFGHTFGHAIEAGMGFGVWLHGEGVAAGMVMAAHLSQRLGLIDAALVQRLTRLIERAGLPTRGPVIDASDNAGKYLELMRGDKKSEAGEIRFVVIEGAGQAGLRTAPDELVREVIDACCEAA